jgi:hypothetical protein
MHDIIFISTNKDTVLFNEFKKKYPFAKQASTYSEAKSKAFTKLFWLVWDDVVVNNDFNFTYDIPEWDYQYIHVFKNEGLYDGVCLSSKIAKVSEREFKHRFFINKKEVDIEASSPRRYDKFYINTYEDYLAAIELSNTELFWGIPSKVEILDNSLFDLYFRHNDKYNREENHVWKNICNDTVSYINGLTLFTKHKLVSKKEINFSFLINKKEYDKIATRFRYPKYYINTYEEYLEICKTETQPLFWCIWPEIEITDSTVFDMYFDPLDGTYDYDRIENHVFQNQDIDEIKYNGLMLMSTSTIVYKKEINFRYIVVKKEHTQLVSKLKLYDIVFISYYEPNAEENYIKLTKQFPNRTIHRVTNVTGIHQAHIQAAAISTTPMFWVVDADAVILDDFKFDLLLPKYDRDAVYVWKSQNPINDLEYGYGGVKLLPTKETLEIDISSTDMTTSISKKFNAMPTVSNITAFNTDPFNTWKSAFRECVKLASRSIQGQVDTETSNRLDRWCTLVDDASYGVYAYSGALAGRAYGQENAGNIPALSLINDFKWLKNQFQQTHLPLEKSQQ